MKSFFLLFPFFSLIYVFFNNRHFGNRHFGTVDIMGIDILGIDILAPTRIKVLKIGGTLNVLKFPTLFSCSFSGLEFIKSLSE